MCTVGRMPHRDVPPNARFFKFFIEKNLGDAARCGFCSVLIPNIQHIYNIHITRAYMPLINAIFL